MSTENKSVKSLARRLFDFQQEDIEILKTKKGHGYHYAPLDSIEKIIKPFLKKHGIAYIHQVGYDADLQQSYVKTMFFNLDDEDDFIENITYINEKASLAKMNEFMVIGSAITYFRRYHITATLGLTTDEDTDAGGAIQTADKSKTKAQGRSVDVVKSEPEIDFMGIFKNQLANGKPKDTVLKTLANYKAQMNDDMYQAISKMINEYK